MEEHKKQTKDYYYKIYSINELKQMIKSIKTTRGKKDKNVLNGNATIVLRFKETENFKGQLEELKNI